MELIKSYFSKERRRAFPKFNVFKFVKKFNFNFEFLKLFANNKKKLNLFCVLQLLKIMVKNSKDVTLNPSFQNLPIKSSFNRFFYYKYGRILMSYFHDKYDVSVNFTEKKLKSSSLAPKLKRQAHNYINFNIF